MDIQIQLAVLLSVVSVAFSIYFGMKNSKRTDTKDIEERVKRDTIVNTKLDEIGNNVKNIKDDVSTVRQDTQSIDKRLIVVEQSVKSAHHRIDSLEGREKEEKGYE